MLPFKIILSARLFPFPGAFSFSRLLASRIRGLFETFEENPTPFCRHIRDRFGTLHPSSQKEDTHTHAHTHARTHIDTTTMMMTMRVFVAFVVLFAAFKATIKIECLIKGAEAFAFPLLRHRDDDGDDDDDDGDGAALDQTTWIARFARDVEHTLSAFERHRGDVEEETKSFDDGFVGVFERRPRRVLGDFNSSEWKAGRATWYGGPSGPGPDGMSIYTGSCGYGEDLGNHFVTAVQTDGGYDYGLTEECGKCIEVVCVDGPTRGFEWSELGKWAGCQEPAVKSVVVKITDSCPCNHPNEGNKRWCCGDREHLDLSYAAFDQIAIRHRGVVDLKFRPASCKDQGKVVSYY